MLLEVTAHGLQRYSAYGVGPKRAVGTVTGHLLQVTMHGTEAVLYAQSKIAQARDKLQ